MKTTRQSGILITDCLIYMGLLFLIVGMSYAVFYRGWDNSLNLRRNAEHIARAMTAGERWREDVRTATGPLRFDDADGERTLHVPHGADEVAYRARQETILRRANSNAAWVEVLNHVKTSRMEPDARENVAAWRWELELKTRERKRKITPLLTFEAVPTAAKTTNVAETR